MLKSKSIYISLGDSVSSNKLIFGILFGILAIGITSNQLVFAEEDGIISSVEVTRELDFTNFMELVVRPCLGSIYGEEMVTAYMGEWKL